MKQFITLFIILNLIMGVTYVWGADHNRYICLALWFIIPILNTVLFGLFEKQINEA